MSDRLFYPLAALTAVLMVALGLVWPQGFGARSPAPFGHEVEVPDYVVAERRKAAEDAAKAAQAAAQPAAAPVAQPAPEAK
ncbi:hypothetical protein [Caulobacter sp. 17J80-11]|uniref:hypothetical protein n=1 Tax=Caulobacter sp. 17J80-11 TaxID=2763502 RepID=UPI001653A251|nr:hypothetical protein [Caulobacter sp. 17J80-11]MBC6982402.1 hypothetical protein [Caulobacter sp. 17J80-11]